MKELELNNKIVIEWPLDKPFPKIGEAMSAGVLGVAHVCDLYEQHERMGCGATVKRVGIRIYPIIELDVLETVKNKVVEKMAEHFDKERQLEELKFINGDGSSQVLGVIETDGIETPEQIHE